MVIVGKVLAKDEREKFLNKSEVDELGKQIKSELNPDYPARYMILLALNTGMRFAEVLGLTWDCIDFKERTIRVEKSDHMYTKDFKGLKNKSSNRQSDLINLP